MPYFRKKQKKHKENEYPIFSHAHNKKVIFTLEELKKCSATLPLRCKAHLETTGPLTPIQQKELLLLADISMQVWGGGPKGRLPYIHIEDYYTEFYINMCRYLEKLIPEKAGAWVALCRFMGFDTCNKYINGFKKQEALRIALEDLQFDLEHLYPEAYAVEQSKDPYAG